MNNFIEPEQLYTDKVAPVHLSKNAMMTLSTSPTRAQQHDLPFATTDQFATNFNSIPTINACCALLHFNLLCYSHYITHDAMRIIIATNQSGSTFNFSHSMRTHVLCPPQRMHFAVYQ